MSTLQVNPEEMAHDSRLQFFAMYVLDGLRARGLIHTKTSKKSLLTSAERRLVEEMKAKGLTSFDDTEFQAAIVWCAAGAGIVLDETELMKALQYVVA